jgi:hypothetical protein
VDLLDENDHKPLFLYSNYEGLIREDALPGTLVKKKPVAGAESNPLENEKKPLVLESSDLDVGLNALVTYSIIEEEEMRKVKDFFVFILFDQNVNFYYRFSIWTHQVDHYFS